MDTRSSSECRHSVELMCVTCLAERWGCSRNTIGVRWRTGQMPAPFNPDQSSGYRWHRSIIEAHELGADRSGLRLLDGAA